MVNLTTRFTTKERKGASFCWLLWWPGATLSQMAEERRTGTKSSRESERIAHCGLAAGSFSKKNNKKRPRHQKREETSDQWWALHFFVWGNRGKKSKKDKKAVSSEAGRKSRRHEKNK